MKTATFVLLVVSIPWATSAHPFSCSEYGIEREQVRVETVNSLARIVARIASNAELCREIREEVIPMAQRHIGSMTKFTSCEQFGPMAEQEIQSKRDYIKKMDRDAAELCVAPNK
ncbi:MAG: hypothetical protein K8F90_08185 [Hyphomicrobiales bacterium]|nr:hypothetical protein [Hyphomicrobiales bacterium]